MKTSPICLNFFTNDALYTFRVPQVFLESSEVGAANNVWARFFCFFDVQVSSVFEHNC